MMMMGSRGNLDFLVSTESSERSLKLEQKNKEEKFMSLMNWFEDKCQ
jgi:hypothetical protein